MSSNNLKNIKDSKTQSAPSFSQQRGGMIIKGGIPGVNDTTHHTIIETTTGHFVS